jgi:hypothetical protein
MRKDWIRTEEERELRRLRTFQKEQKKLNKLPNDHQPILDLPIVVRKKKRVLPTAKKPVAQQFIIQKVGPINK